MTVGGAGTIVNAMATGRGSAFGIGYRSSARVRPAPRWMVFTGGRRLDAVRSRLAIESARLVLGDEPHRIDVDSDIPPERGLKSSSSVSLAVLEACLRLTGRAWTEDRLLRAAATAGLRSGTSLTGAFDDAAACLRGGIVLTDNRRRRILSTSAFPLRMAALVHAPRLRRPTRSVRGMEFGSIRALVDDAFHLALKGRFRDAMVLNTAAYAPLFRLRPRFSIAALESGCHAAGLSGKGPSEVAVGTRPQLRDLARRFPNTRLLPLRRGTR